MSEQYVTRGDFAQVTDAMVAIQETTTRVDERVRTLLERQSKADVNIHEICSTINALVGRVTILETQNTSEMKVIVERSREKIYELEKQVQLLTFKESGNDHKWKTIFDFVGKIIWIAVAAWVLYKLNLPAPSIS